MKKIIIVLHLLLLIVAINAQKHVRNVSVLDKMNTLPLSVDIKNDNYSFDYEPKQRSQFNWAYTYCNTIYFDDGYGDGSCDIYDIYIDGDGFVTNIFVLLPLGSPSLLPLGTYEFKPNFQLNSALSSSGGNDDYDTPSFVGTDIDDPNEGTYFTSYFITTGKITVALEGTDTVMDISATTYYGSTININLTGKPTNTDQVLDNDFVIYSNNGDMVVKSGDLASVISVYDARGRILHRAITQSEMTIEGLPRHEVLIVRIADKVKKIIL